MAKKIGALIVLYEPDLSGFKSTFDSLLSQVDGICIVDNSIESHLLWFEGKDNVIYLPLLKNIGIAAAQNIGIEKLRDAGYEYIPAGVLTDETIDLSKVIVVFMDYTNHREDEPSQMQGDFWYRVFQNGVELDRNFCSYYSDKYAPFEDNYKEVMMGGTITAGNFFLLEDDSPITIVANEQGSSDNKQSMTVELN